MTSFDSKAVEVDNIRFETLVPEPELIVPKKRRGTETPVQIGIRITNNTLTPLRFSFYASLTPEIIGADREALQVGYYSDWSTEPLESDFPLVLPGEYVTFFPYAKLLWLRDQFRLLMGAGDGGFWFFGDLKLGTYQIRFRYQEDSEWGERTFDEEELIEQRLLERVWLGQVDTSFVEFYLIQP